MEKKKKKNRETNMGCVSPTGNWMSGLSLRGKEKEEIKTFQIPKKTM